MKTTIKELAEKLGLDYSLARALIQYMLAKSLATEVGKTESNGKGKKSCIYEVPDKIEIQLN
ncbi:MAG: hypothetical protein AABY22_07045 [Nanoarchaeota archaeon]